MTPRSRSRNLHYFFGLVVRESPGRLLIIAMPGVAPITRVILVLPTTLTSFSSSRFPEAPPLAVPRIAPLNPARLAPVRPPRAALVAPESCRLWGRGRLGVHRRPRVQRPVHSRPFPRRPVGPVAGASPYCGRREPAQRLLPGAFPSLTRLASGLQPATLSVTGRKASWDLKHRRFHVAVHNRIVF